MSRVWVAISVLILPSIGWCADPTFSSVVISTAACGVGATFNQQGTGPIDSGLIDSGPSQCENQIGQRASGQAAASPRSLGIEGHVETTAVAAGAVSAEAFAIITLIPPDPCFTGSVDIVAGSDYSLLLGGAGAGSFASVSFSITSIDGVNPPTGIGDSKQITSSATLTGRLSAPFTIPSCPCTFVMDVQGLVGANFGVSGVFHGSLFLQLPPGWRAAVGIDQPAGGPSIRSISPSPVIGAAGAQNLFVNGSGFQNGAGVHVANGAFQADLSGSQVTFISCAQLSVRLDVGTVAASWTAQVTNPGAHGSNVVPFDVVDSRPTFFALPQFTFGGAWYTALYFANTTDLVVQVPVTFFNNSGGPLLVPLLGIGLVSSQSISLNPHSTAILEAPSSNSPQQEGWAEAVLPPGVTGYGVFRQTVAGRADQEAVVPLTPESSQIADLTYDDTGFTTAVAFVNPTGQTGTVTINTFDATGAANGSAQIVLTPFSKLSAVLKALPGLSGISGKRGRAVFSAPGAISVLGLRFGGSAFTSIPVLHRPGFERDFSIWAGFAVPQFVFGGNWYTAIYLTNTGKYQDSFGVLFSGNDGGALPLQLSGIGTVPIFGPVSYQRVVLPGGSTLILEAPLTNSPGEGWAETVALPGLTGYAVFRQTIAGRADQEAAVPLTPEESQAADLIYDDVNFTTAVAFLNAGYTDSTVTITVYSANGVQIGTTQVALPYRNKVATILKNLPGLSAMAGNRGWASFSVPSSAISVLGLRFGGEAFTSIPVAHR